MHFSPFQILVTYLVFAATLALAVFWHRKEEKSAKRESDKESFPVLMAVFFYSVFFALLLKMLMDLGVIYFPELVVKEWVKTIFLALEELVKAFALIVGLNIADKRFNERSDGAIYAVFAALGFVFFENIFYLLGYAPNFYNFMLVFMGRHIFSFAAHLSIVVFGLYYASAYLYSKDLEKRIRKEKKQSRIPPYRVDKMFKFLWDKYHLQIIIWLPLSPFILLYQTFRGKKTNVTMSEMLVGGFLLSVYIHVSYDHVLKLEIPWLNSFVLFTFGTAMVLLYNFFPKLDVK